MEDANSEKEVLQCRGKFFQRRIKHHFLCIDERATAAHRFKYKGYEGYSVTVYRRNIRYVKFPPSVHIFDLFKNYRYLEKIFNLVKRTMYSQYYILVLALGNAEPIPRSILNTISSRLKRSWRVTK